MQYELRQVFSGAKYWTIYANSREEAWAKWENQDCELKSDNVDEIDIILIEYDK